MSKTTSKKQTGLLKGDRTIGIHQSCGGTVVYWSGPTCGHRTCQKCGQSSSRGASPTLESEVQS